MLQLMRHKRKLLVLLQVRRQLSQLRCQSQAESYSCHGDNSLDSSESWAICRSEQIRLGVT